MLRTLLRRRPSPAMIVALAALFVALGGSAGALVVVTSKNIRNGTIRGKDIHKRTITSARVKKNGLGGSVIKESSLGFVPDAKHAASADTAASAGTATRAGTASGIAAPEPYRRVQFQNSCANSGTTAETAAFFKDREGVVHLKGNIVCPSGGVAFQLPAGYRPASGEQLQYPEPNNAFLNIFGPGVTGMPSGAVLCFGPPGSTQCWLDGTTFRAQS